MYCYRTPDTVNIYLHFVTHAGIRQASRGCASALATAALTRPQPRADGLRRPLWFARPYRPAPSAFYRKTAETSLSDGSKARGN